MTEQRRARRVEPGYGKSVTLYGVRFTYKVEAEDAGGALAVLETEIPPRTLVKPHRHRREDEFSLVLKGAVGVRLGDEEFEAPAGTYLVKPRGVPHALWNAGREPATVVEILSPAGFERYFAEIEPILAQEGPDANARFYELAEEYGVVIEDDWVDDLEARYGVKLNPPPEDDA